jgi:dephospho-CoA kinase
MGAGKSAASAYLSELGFPVIDSDALAREVVAPDTPGLAAVAAEFGPRVIAADGSLDRATLGRAVFAEPGARHRLEAVLHPLIRAESARRGEAARLAGHAAAIFDIPLLVETGQAQDFDLVVTVSVPESMRLERAQVRGLSAEQARARLDAQASDGEREAVADVILDGSGTVENLRAQIDRSLLRRIGQR